AWLDAILAAAADGQANLDSYTAAPKHLGRASLLLDEREQRDMNACAPDVVFDRWTVVDAARALLLLTVANAAAHDVFTSAATEWYEQGDSGEQQSWLKALPLLPQPDRFA